jgi:glycosyltransferase involved in cell wall biosynthesis
LSNSKKKIILVGPAYPLRGGIANFNESLALELRKAGHSVEIVSFYYQYPSLLFPGKSQYGTTEKAPQGISIKSLISSINPLSWGKTASYIQSTQPDLVIIRFWMPFMAPSLGTIAKKLRKKSIKVIAITDNVIPHEKRIGDKQLTQYFINQIDGFVAMSHSVLDDIATFTDNSNKIMLPHPVYNLFGEKVSREEGIRFLKLESDCSYLLFFGLIRGYKGLDLALKAMAEPCVRDKNIRLIIAGEYYDKKEKYDALIAELGIADRILQFDHYIPAEEVKYYFAVADCVLQPYKTATQSGITQVAYNFDTPMIVTNVGGLPEIVENGKVGFVVEVNEKAIAEGICTFYDQQLNESFSDNVSKAKEKFSWHYFVQQLITKFS